MTNIIESKIDLYRFGVKTGKVFITNADSATNIDSEARSNNFRWIIARCESTSISAAQQLEDMGFRLMDTLLYSELQKLPDVGSIPPCGYNWRHSSPDDSTVVSNIARSAFSGYQSHYHADPKLPRDLCNETYADWASKSCLDSDIASQVIIAYQTHEPNHPIAFGALKVRERSTIEGVLFAVDPHHLRRGLFSFLLKQCCFLAKELNFAIVLYSTQITNIATQRTLGRLGFLPTKYVYTFHKWYEQE
jgi:GNAT superfamily N-acetyltransferase